MKFKTKMTQAFVFGLFDILIVVFSYGLALLMRFDISWSKIPVNYLVTAMTLLPVAVGVTLLTFAVTKMYSFVWSFVSLRDSYRICGAVVIANVLTFSISFMMQLTFPRSVYGLVFIFQLMAVGVLRFSVKMIREFTHSRRNYGQKDIVKRTMIIGAGSTGELIAKEISISKKVDMSVACFIDENREKHGKILNGISIVGGKEAILHAVEKYAIQVIVLAIPSALPQRRKDIIELCQKTDCELRIIPSVTQLMNEDVHIESIRKVEIEDLLDREPIQVNMGEIMNYVADKIVLVTGGGGSIGSEICRQIAKNKPRLLVVFDIYENNAYDLQLELQGQYPELNLEVLIGSVRDGAKVDHLFSTYKPHLVYHAAAHKHVPLMEDSPNEAIKNNVFGTYNVANNADKHGAQKMVLISTDKAVNPTNIMGASKRLCEMVVQYFSRRSKTEFAAVRFGNVLGSNGSVVPIFKRQIAEGGPVTVTHPNIIRYFMTIPEAVSLVLQAGAYAQGGEIFVLDMGKPVKIDTLAKNLIRLSGFTPNVDIMIEYTGLRPGEKLFEELLLEEEGMHRTPNAQIFIGSPIQMDDEKFLADLMELQKSCRQNSNEIRKLVSVLVPTYKRGVK